MSESDVIRTVLHLTRNVYEEYQKAPDALKRHYLGLFWDRFVVQDREIVRAIPSQLMRTLQEEQATAITFDAKLRRGAQEDEEVIRTSNWLRSSPLIITMQNQAYLTEIAAKVEAIQTFRERERAA